MEFKSIYAYIWTSKMNFKIVFISVPSVSSVSRREYAMFTRQHAGENFCKTHPQKSRFESFQSLQQSLRSVQMGANTALPFPLTDTVPTSASMQSATHNRTRMLV